MNGRDIKVISWNVYALNKQVPDAFAFIQSLDFDVLCLQEVPDALLDMLRTLPCQLISGTDRRWATDAWHPEHGESTMHLVILSKHPILAHSAYPQITRSKKFKIQTLAYHFARYVIGMWRGGQGHGSEVIAADITIKDEAIRIWCAHLSLTTPQIRAREFETIQKNLDTTKKNIVCGDFNTLDYWMMRPLNWLEGGRIVDVLPWAPERKDVEKQFADSGLANPLAGQSTHPIAHSQLDHILVPIGSETHDAHVIHELNGSDHYPVSVIVSI